MYSVFVLPRQKPSMIFFKAFHDYLFNETRNEVESQET